NINRNPDGTFWVGLVSPRSPAADALAGQPFLRKVVQRLPASIRPKPQRYGFVFRIDADGTVLETMQDPSGLYALTTGMIVSNEPGYYREDGFGIRCENLQVVQPANLDGEIPVFEFEPLTFVPFDTRLLDVNWLEPKHIQWLNHYHQAVWERISPQLNGDDLAWLEQATRPL
ncbi:MAG: M24 family metallopeptidase C-terminal domain-containing protein, partial [Oceanisphaera sp.]|nr:M24 family metallopeptidase C-terminal domain-containing protein [Oceanisphaera sp.]